MPKLVSLTIDFACDVDKDGFIIFQSILQFPTLKYLNITASLWAFDLKIPMTIDSKPSLIERMILNVGLRVSELVTIIQHTPKLKYLSCINIVESNDINLNDQSLLLTQLTYLSIKNFQADFDEFEYLMKRISSQVRILRLKASPFRSFFSENRWRQLINKHMPVLHKFHFDCFTEDDDLDYGYFQPDPAELKEFTSSFWTDRNWYFELTDIPSQFILSIDSADPEKSNIRLRIAGYALTAWYDQYIENAKPIYAAIEFTHLSIDCSYLLPNLMIEILYLLPKLTSLEVIYLTPIYPDYSSLPFTQSELEMRSFILMNSKITKVTAYQTSYIELILKLCPRIQYLEIEYTDNINLEKIIGCIAVNSRTHNCYLNCICLMNPRMNDVIIQDMKRFINFERLLDFENEQFNNYVIQEKDNKIFLTWELP